MKQAGKDGGVQYANHGQPDRHTDALAAQGSQKRQGQRVIVGFAGRCRRPPFQVNGPFHYRDIENVHIGGDQQAAQQAHQQRSGEYAFHKSPRLRRQRTARRVGRRLSAGGESARVQETHGALLLMPLGDAAGHLRAVMDALARQRRCVCIRRMPGRAA